ncbi:tRNA pseudouridine(55) synthase TruB [bacterium]|nr:tRNA pseudouridine(55) synthase TruB [bacterium]
MGVKQKTADFTHGVILNIDKPGGMTSFQIVKRIRHWTGCKKVGHAGTLDPLATGVLLVCTGKATKQISDLMALDKIYHATIRLGISTDTDDSEGAVLATRPVPELKSSDLDKILDAFRGNFDQVPPQYSAIKFQGRRLYLYAREGVHIDLKPRPVTVHRLDIVSWEPPVLRISVRCGKGTYIRSMARDLGNLLKTGGHITGLRRMAVGTYHVDDAWTLDDFKNMIDHENIQIG